MQLSRNRSVVIISGLLTLLVLSGGALALGFHNGWLRTGSGAATPEAIGADSQPKDARNAAPIAARPSAAGSSHAVTQDEAGQYRQKLDEAYRALDDAYAQIRVLQSPQPQLASARNDDDRFREQDGDDDRRGRRSDRRRSHDD